MTEVEYDVVIVGAGPVGENVADRTAAGGMRTVIVEAELVGGECSYWACMPSKTLLRSAALVRSAQRVAGAREALTGELDVQAVLKRRDWVTGNWTDDGQPEWLESIGVDLVRGHGAITGPRQVRVTAPDGSVTDLRARVAVVVSTGSAALLPDVPGLRESEPWTSRDATSVHSVPESLAIIGGGVVAVEMATAYAGFGARVELIARHGLLDRQEPFAAEMVAEALADLGVNVHLNATTKSVRRDDDGIYLVALDGDRVIDAERLLVATGRIPRTGDLGLETVGLKAGDWLTVDDSLRVIGTDGEPFDGGWLYAVGDVNHRALMTHQGKYQARIAGDAIAARAGGRDLRTEPWSTYAATADHSAVPQVTFTDPEVASVGLTAAQAEKAGYRIRVVDHAIDVSGATIAAEHYVGQARLVIDEDRQVVIGATFVGADIGELLHSATIAVVGEVPLNRLWHAVPSYPTLSEIWLRLLEAYGRPTA